MVDVAVFIKAARKIEDFIVGNESLREMLADDVGDEPEDSEEPEAAAQH